MKRCIAAGAIALGCLSASCSSNTSVQGAPVASSVTGPEAEAIKQLSEKGITPLNPSWNSKQGVLIFGMTDTVCAGEYHPGNEAGGVLPVLTVRHGESVAGWLVGDNITFQKVRTDPPLEKCWMF